VQAALELTSLPALRRIFHTKKATALSCNIGSLPIFMGHVKGIYEWRFMGTQRGKGTIYQED
jgi:hypothetical protein